MKPNLYVSPQDVECLLFGFSAYKDLTEQQRNLLKRLASIDFTTKAGEGFYFPALYNSHTKIHCIKTLRALTGLGLKEAKDAVEQETRFSLLGYDLTAEKVLAVALEQSGIVHKVVVAFE